MTVCASERRSAVTPAVAGSAWPCPEVEGTACSGGACPSPPQGQPGDSSLVPPQTPRTKLMASVWRSARLIHSVPGDSGAPAAAVTTSAWTSLEVRSLACQPGPPGDMCGCHGVPHGEVPQAKCLPAR